MALEKWSSFLYPHRKHIAEALWANHLVYILYTVFLFQAQVLTLQADCSVLLLFSTTVVREQKVCSCVKATEENS